MAHHSWVGLGATLGLAALAACSAPPAAPPAPPAPPARSTPAACTALLAFDGTTVTYPGGDPSAPAPSADQVKRWAATAVAPIGGLAANIPADYADEVATLRTAVTGAQNGTPINTNDPTIVGASTTLDKWGRDNCGFATMDVTNDGTDLAGVPATLPKGPLSFSFADSGAPAEKAGYVLVVAKVKDGAKYTLDGIRDGSVDFTSVADVVGIAQPTKEEPEAFSTATLTPGKYLVVTPIGPPPQFTGILAGEFAVS
ncbi:MAG TPA: hypothetical protein VGE11_10915 [Pseudonocardia sp.]